MECCVRRSASRYQKNGIGFGSRGRSLWPEANVTSPEKELLPVRYVSALLVPKLSRMSEGEDTKSGESTYPRIQDGRDWTWRPCSYGHRHSLLGRPEVPVFCIHHRRIYSLYGAHTFVRPVSSVLSPRVSVWLYLSRARCT